MDRRLPPLESLRVFEASARHSNFSKAARELGITPAAVSLRIRHLEADLGQRLFQRNGPRIAPTPEGALLAERVGEIMALARAAVTECRSTAAPLRITVTPTFSARWLMPRLPRYRALPDAARIRLEVSTDLRSPDQYDVAIRSGRGGWPDLVATRLLPMEVTPMLSPALAARGALETPADLQRLPLIHDENWEAWFRAAGVDEPRFAFAPIEYGTQEMSAGAAIEGAGVALLSTALFADDLAQGVLVRPFTDMLHTGGAYFAIRHRNERRLAVDHFIRWLRDEVGSNG